MQQRIKKESVRRGNGMTNPNEPTLTCSEAVERLPSENDVRVECKELLEKALALIKVKQGSEAEFERLLAHALATFAEKKTRGHLAELSRRERRVQELEEALRLAGIRIGKCAGRMRGCNEHNREVADIGEYHELVAEVDDWQKEAENALKLDEWREQIRKGAKHEL